jgi:hypothetical protein
MLLKWLGARGLLGASGGGSGAPALRAGEGRTRAVRAREEGRQGAPERQRVEREFAGRGSDLGRVAARGGSVASRLAELDARLRALQSRFEAR